MVQALTLLIVIGYFIIGYFIIFCYCLLLGMNGRGRSNGTANLPLVQGIILKKPLRKIIPTNIITMRLPESSATDISLTTRLTTLSFFFMNIIIILIMVFFRATTNEYFVSRLICDYLSN